MTGCEKLTREATEWFERIHGGTPETAEIAEWQRWLGIDPSHRAAFDEVEAFWRTSGELRSITWPSHAELATDRYDGAVPIAAWRARQAQRRCLARLVVAVIAMAGLIALWVPHRPGLGFSGDDLAIVATVSGEQRNVQLPDGSTMLVGPGSEVMTDFAARARNVTVVRGEAFFTVEHDRDRPFVVRAGAGTITAVGTAFTVRNLEGRVAVAVTEGTVDVASMDALTDPGAPRVARTRLRVGQEITYGDVRPTVRSIDPVRVEERRAGRLQFLGDPLRVVVPDVERYTQLQIVIVDAEVGELLYTGTVMPDEIDAWLESLPKAFPVVVSRQGEHTVLLALRAH